jgi:hypothetical protein
MATVNTAFAEVPDDPDWIAFTVTTFVPIGVVGGV